MTDISREAVEALAYVLQCNGLEIASDTLLALRAEVDALEDRAYRLGYAICGGEDAPGLVNSIETEWFESTIAKERAYARDEREALEAKLEAAEAELGQAKKVVAQANNSLFGSLNYFLSLNGNDPNEYHLSEPIEDMKARSNRIWRELNDAKAKLAERVTVKPLEWGGDFAHTGLGMFYHIDRRTGNALYRITNSATTGLAAGLTDEEYHGIAQADFDSKVRASITTTPITPAAAAKVLLEAGVPDTAIAMAALPLNAESDLEPSAWSSNDEIRAAILSALRAIAQEGDQ